MGRGRKPPEDFEQPEGVSDADWQSRIDAANQYSEYVEHVWDEKGDELHGLVYQGVEDSEWKFWDNIPDVADDLWDEVDGVSSQNKFNTDIGAIMAGTIPDDIEGKADAAISDSLMLLRQHQIGVENLETAKERMGQYQELIDGEITNEEFEEGEADRQEQMAEDSAQWRSDIEDIIAEVDIEFKEQCLLLSFVHEIAEWKKAQDKSTPGYKYLPYVQTGNASLLLDGDPFAFMNRLTQYENQKEFYNMETHEIANLQPSIRLYKVIDGVNDRGQTVEEEIEIKFDSYLNLDSYVNEDGAVEDIFNNKYKRGYGAGIKNFTFSYEADNPYALKKAIKGRLAIFANDFDELLRDRDGYKYIDLAMKTGKTTADGCPTVTDFTNLINPKESDEQTDNLAKLNFKLKAVVGWSPLPYYIEKDKNTGENSTVYTTNSTLKSEVRDAIYNSYITLNLTPTIHEFNIDEFGRVEFVLNYLAYVEDFFDQPSFNIFSDPRLAARIIERKIRFKVHNKNCEAEELDSFKKDQLTRVQEDKEVALKALITRLISPAGDDPDCENVSKIFHLSLPFRNIDVFNSQGPYFEYDVSLGISRVADGDMIAAVKEQVSEDVKEGLTTEEQAAKIADNAAANDEVPAGGSGGRNF